MIYMRRDFQKLGYRRESFVTVLEKTSVFEGLRRIHGVATEFSFNQAVFLCIGMELSQCGMSARHINRVLFRLSNREFDRDTREKYVDPKSVVWVWFDTEQDRLKHDRYIGYKTTILGRNLVSGKDMAMEERARTHVIDAEIFNLKTANNFRSSGKMTCFTEIHLWRIISDLLNATR